jgi:antibiotic biosynthesis monooxygenase (ABM) superfamily enzyme
MAAGQPRPHTHYKMAIVTDGRYHFHPAYQLDPCDTAGYRRTTPVFARMLLVVAIMLLLITHVLMPSIITVPRPWLSKKTVF